MRLLRQQKIISVAMGILVYGLVALNVAVFGLLIYYKLTGGMKFY